MTDLFSRGALKIVIVGDIFNNIALWILLIVKEVGEYNPWRSCLLLYKRLPFLLLVTLSFLLLAFWG